jgi:regulator of PEP synthase PpsR (kinase-PPPase family)
MYQIFAASDATGVTAERVLQAALTQFDATNVTITRYGGIRTPKRINEIVESAASVGGFIVHTFVSEELRRLILKEGRDHNVTTIDLMGPLLARLSELLAAPPRAEPGLYSTFDPSYMQRIEAIDFTVRHDDGRNFHDLEKAEIVLVGVSRTSKTPLSIYLGYRGWKVANVPIVLGVEPPRELLNLPRGRVIGLIVKADRLSELRRVRATRMGTSSQGYADLEHIREEMDFAFKYYEQRKDWPLVDVTTKSIEEAAAEVVALLGNPVKQTNPFDDV